MSSTHGAVSTELLGMDARNRALRAFLINITADVGVALTLVIVATFGQAESWSDFEWSLMAFTLAKTAVVTAGSYVLRRFLDPSFVPTPLPPAPVAAPSEPARPQDS